MRLAENGTVYRNELSGALHGLTRVRGFTQDDSHLFVTPEQLEEETSKVLDFVMSDEGQAVWAIGRVETGAGITVR